jgi:S1-C subfamily serine protease
MTAQRLHRRRFSCAQPREGASKNENDAACHRPGGGPADRAGLRAGDVIRAADGTPTPDTQALAGVLAAADPGDQVSLAVDRGGQELTVKLTLGQLPAN